VVESGCPRYEFYTPKLCVFGKTLERGSWVEARNVVFFCSRGTLPAMHHIRKTGHYDGTGQTITVLLNLFHCWDPLNATVVVWDPQVKIEKVCAPEESIVYPGNRSVKRKEEL